MDTHVDSDWAGCQKTRRSTSGFIIFLLGCVVRFGARTQQVPALSSAEAELYGIGTGVAESLHIKSFLEEAKLFKKVRKYYENDGVEFSGDPLDDYDILIDCLNEDLEVVEVG